MSIRSAQIYFTVLVNAQETQNTMLLLQYVNLTNAISQAASYVTFDLTFALNATQQ